MAAVARRRAAVALFHDIWGLLMQKNTKKKKVLHFSLVEFGKNVYLWSLNYTLLIL